MARPALQRLLEAVAAVMGLDRGEQRLALTFQDGRLVGWQARSLRAGPEALARFESATAERLAQRVDVGGVDSVACVPIRSR